MGVRAKMYVAEVKRFAYNKDNAEIVLRAVTRGGDDNKEWAAATPSGELKLTIGNPAAVAALADHLGEDFYVDISLVPVEPTE